MLQKKLTPSLAQKLYSGDQVRQLEAQAAHVTGIEMYTLMQRAGASVYEHCVALFPKVTQYLVMVGGGNNAGDGYVTALAARNAGKQVILCAIDPTQKLKGDAAKAQQAWLNAGGRIETFSEEKVEQAQIIVDGLLGTGISGSIRAEFKKVIDTINVANVPIISIDVPSGLNANTGASLGDCIHATATVTFIGIKQGLTTGAGKQACGQLIFEDLGVGQAFADIAQSTASLLEFENCQGLHARALNSHKGTYGRLLCIGGNKGMPGSIRMTAEAALRTGAGLVKVYTHEDSILPICSGRPELMVTSNALKDELNWASCIVIGPGLGQDEWSENTFNEVLNHVQQHPKPIIIDADGLNLLSHIGSISVLPDCVITPHVGEASRLLKVPANEIESNRFVYARKCALHYHATCILKGAGSIIDIQGHAWVCGHGNPGMATAGMGDVLAGILGGLMAQGLEKNAACQYGVSIHAKAGDIMADKFGQRGLLATDLFDTVRMLVNELQ